MKKILNAPVIVGALGYFVDIYDLVLFSVVRTPSLKAIGLKDSELLSNGIILINCQMTGMLLGGIIWGILGDKRGRLSVLFGSILLYSLANVANAFVTNVETYALLRFLAGIGLAGELGAAITLVSEVMSPALRGYGTAIVAGIGVCGATVASLIGDWFDWKIAYLVGGGLGFILLILRVSLKESGIFQRTKQSTAKRGDLRMLLFHQERLLKLIFCVLVGVPIWFVIGILMTFAPEIAKAIGVANGVDGAIRSSDAIFYSYAGLALGDLGSGFLSQWFKSRRTILFAFITITFLGMLAYLNLEGQSAKTFYTVCFLLGLGSGYWAIFVSIAAEQFGTNLRATVAISVPNLVRGSVVPLTLGFHALSTPLGLPVAATWVGTACMALAIASAWFLPETFGRNLDFEEL